MPGSSHARAQSAEPAAEPACTALEPIDWPVLRRSAHAMLDDALDHMQGVATAPLWRAPPQALRDRRRSPLPVDGAGLDATHAVFRDEIMPYPGGNAHPGFMGWAQGAGTPTGMLAEMLAAAMNANLGGRDHMAVEVEREVAGWTREMFAFPDAAEGLFVTGASQANFIGVLVARGRALGPAVRRTGLAGAPRLTAYASAAAHGCIARALEMAGLGSDALRRVRLDDAGRVDLVALRATLETDRAAGCTPFLLVGSAGTVDTGAIDDLEALADLAAAQDLHLHVDGAFGALAVLSPRLKPRLRGIERADSLAFDWHKWGQAPYDAGYALVRDGAQLRRTFAADAAYLARADRGLAAGDWWACDHGPDLSRSFRALKVWFTLKTHGAAALAEAMERSCVLAQRLAAGVVASEALELRAAVGLNVVCFGHRGADAQRIDTAIVADLHEAGRVAPSLTRLDGRATIRAAILNHRTRETDVDALLESVLSRGRAHRTAVGEPRSRRRVPA